MSSFRLQASSFKPQASSPKPGNPVRSLRLVACGLWLAVCAVSAQTTENVFVVNIDGMRYTEGFGSGDLNLPFVWDSLRPLGTIYTNFYNTGITVTNSAHSTIVTGVRQMMAAIPASKGYTMVIGIPLFV